MQVQADSDIYIKRSVYYSGALIREALLRGEEYDSIKKSYMISLMKSPLFFNHNRYHSIYLLKECDQNDLLTDAFQMHFLELSKVSPSEKPIEEMNELERFCVYAYNTGNASKQGRRWLEEILRIGGEVVEMTHEILVKISEDDILRERAWAKERYRLDRNSEMAYALRTGREKGEQLKIIEQVCKKLAKAKSPEEISDELEEDFKTIASICDVAKLYAPDYDTEKIYQMLKGKTSL